jgi:CHAT domain-containing protein/WD40 repeat protein/predicted negative regulator of RcsB-dependent stress response
MTFVKLTYSYIVLLISTCLFIPDSKLSATAFTTFENIAQAPGYSPIELKPYTSTVKDVSFSPDGKLIITAFDNGTVRLWDTNGKLITEFKGRTSEGKTAIFSPNGKFIITSSYLTEIWDISGKLLAELEGYNASLSPDGKLIVTTYQGAKLWDVLGKLLVEFKEDKGDPIISTNFSPDSKLIITALRSGIVRVWNTSGKLVTEFISDRNLLKDAIFSPNGKLIFTTSTSSGTSKMWDTSGKMLTELKGVHLLAITSASFSPDSKLIVTTSINSSDFFNRNVQVWDISGKEIAELKGHESDVTGASFSPDGKHIVTVSNDGTARIWDISGKLLATFQGHQGNVNKASFSPDGQRLITASSDGTARVWNLSGKELAVLKLDETIVLSSKAEADRLRDLKFYAPNCAQAFDPWQKALKLYQQISDNENQAVILEKLGKAYYCLGDYTNAIKSYSQASTIAQKFNYPQLQAKNLSNLGNVYNTLADYETAINKYNEALKLLPQENSQIKAEILQGRGNIYSYQGKYNEAIQDYLQALAIDEAIKNISGIAENKVNLASIYLALGDANKAIQYYKEALGIKPIEALSGLGNIYLTLGDINKAIDFYSSSLAKAQQQEDKEGEGNALNSLGFALYKSGKFRDAEKNLRVAIEIWENLRTKLDDTNKVSIFEKQTRTYRLLQKILIAQNKPDAALEISERGRARAFVELIARRLSPSQKEKFNITPLNIEKIKQIAKTEKATLVEYSLINDELKTEWQQQNQESELYIWVVKPTGEVTFHKTDLKVLLRKENINLEKLVTISRQSIGVRGRGGIIASENSNAPKAKEKLKLLHELLIQPITEILPQNPNDRVIFIPQSSLFLVPFPALQDANGKYLIEKHTILTAPSIQVLDLTHQQSVERRNFASSNSLVVGNPTMPSVPPKPGDKPEQLPALPGAEKEAIAIAPLLNTKAIIGSQGTKASIVKKMQGAQIIHLATHGILDDYRGLESALALAPDASFSPKPGQINGLLTAEEILGMKLQAELIVLSACDTGRGKITGDGVIGLSRSLISAGVPSVIVSLWSIPDSPTAELMSQFYTNLKERRMDKAQALRQAMLTTIKTHPSPKDWAAFTLIGEYE